MKADFFQRVGDGFTTRSCKGTNFSEDKSGSLDFNLYLCPEFRFIINGSEENIEVPAGCLMNAVIDDYE
jgi:hypothetical protein